VIKNSVSRDLSENVSIKRNKGQGMGTGKKTISASRGGGSLSGREFLWGSKMEAKNQGDTPVAGLWWASTRSKGLATLVSEPFLKNQ